MNVGFLAEGETNIVSAATSNVSSVFTTAVDMVTGNPVAMIFIGFAIVGGGIKLFKKIMKVKK